MSDEVPAQQEPPATEPPVAEPRKRRRNWAFVSTGALVLVLLFVNAFLVLPYYVLKPGQTVAVSGLVNLPPDKVHPENGKFILTTVSLLRAHPFDIALAWLSPGDQVQSKKEVLGPQTQQQYLQSNQQDMDDSQMTAIAVAMHRAGYPVKLLGNGGQVVAVGNNVPASGKLQPNDVIKSVNGTPVTLSADVVAKVRAIKPGEVAHLHVADAAGHERDVDITVAATPSDPNAGYMGVLVQTKDPHLDTPFPVSFKPTGIGGPSAGLAFTLTLLDELTNGQLTGGKKVATTGTISLDGTVGPVGGVKQKTLSVKRAGAKLFLVPPDEFADAKKQAGKGLKVVAVDNLDQAIAALAANGGDASGLPTTTTVAPTPA